MGKSRSTKGSVGQFTYDFGIAVSQSTVNKLTRLTGASLTLASAFYALKTTAEQYVEILKGNSIRFGGMLSTLNAMEQAQNRLIKGQSYFTMDDQIKGMDRLMAMGIDVKKNFDWINKAAHATGKNYEEFSNMIASAIQGNSQALVDSGLMTQRATRMFDKYEANTIMRQRAILSFVKEHKGLMNAIKNDFETVKDQMRRIKGTWTAFLQSVVGKPNDPNSFYGQIVYSMKNVAVALAANAEKIRRYGYVIGQTLGWVIKQIGYFVVWIGRQMEKALSKIWSITDDFQNQSRSMIVWLEFWKVRIVGFFKKYGDEIKFILKLLIAFKALKWVFLISEAVIASVVRYGRAISNAFLLQKKYITMMGPALGNKFTRWLQSLAVFMPRWLRRIWVSVGKFFERGIFGKGFSMFFKSLVKSAFGLKPLFKFLAEGGRLFLGFLKNIPAIFTAIVRAGKALMSALLGSNPVGWIILAIALLATLYMKSEKFRVFVNAVFKGYIEYLKMIWNTIALIITYIMVGFKKVWTGFKTYIWTPITGFFKKVGSLVGDMWSKFMNTAVGKWINDHIVKPIKGLFQWIVDAWQWVINGVQHIVQWLSKGNTKLSDAAKNASDKYGVPKIPTFGGGNYTENDSTNYLNPANWGGNKNKDNSTPVNPLVSGDKGSPTEIVPTSSDNSTNMSFNNGAIQIIVQKGEDIDENTLARKIKQVILDMQRDKNIRGGE